MDYWESILNEVKNKNNRSFRFIYTNLGMRDQVKQRGRAAHGKKRVVKTYYLGEPYQDLYLTEREAQCVFYFCRGFSNVKIAGALELSPRTIEYYFKNIKQKLSCKSRTELMEKLINNELIQQLKF